MFSRRAAKTVLPVASLLVIANGVQGTFFHLRGISRKPGGFKNFRYNVEMGPPAFAPAPRQPGRRHGPPGLVAAPRGGLSAVPPPDMPKAITPGGKGRFPGFDVLDEVDHWDDVTAGVVLARLDPQPEVSFFTVAEQATAAPLFDQLLGQDSEPKVPVLLLVDRRLALGQTDGWHYEDMPEDGDAWRQTLARARRRRSRTPWRPIPPIDLGTARGTGPSGARRRDLARPAGIAGVEPVDPLHQHGVLLPPVGVERDRFRRPCLPPRATRRSASESGRGGRSPISTASIR